MVREPTLDEFGWDGGGGTDDGEDGEADGGTDDERVDDDGKGVDDGTDDGSDGGGATSGTASDDDRPPATVTCEWTPGGAACEACGATVERRWDDGGDRVCAECKEW